MLYANYLSRNGNRLPNLKSNFLNLPYSSWLFMQVSSGTRPKSWAENKINSLKKRRAKNKARKATNSKKRK